MHSFEKPGEIERHAKVLEELGKKCSSTECIAVDSTNYLYNIFGDEDEQQNCALIRFFRTVPYSDLTPHLQEKVQSGLGVPPAPNLNCLTLLATRGIESHWNDRWSSINHQVIPLASEQIIQTAPMIAQLIEKLGIKVRKVVEPTPGLFISPKSKTYHCLYVPEAQKSSAIVSQEAFVKPFGIRSVIGFGGLLPSGAMFAIIMFFKVFIELKTAERCNLLAAAIETSINNMQSTNTRTAKILIASGADDNAKIMNILGSSHSITAVHSVSQAISCINRDNYDLILCGTNFDDSRMFEFLSAVKKTESGKTKPFICFGEMASQLALKTEETTAMAASLSGATCYLPFNKMSDDYLLSALKAYLPKVIWNE